MGRKKEDRKGEFGYNNNGERMTIVRYGNKRDIDVQFDDGTIVEHREYKRFKDGQIKNPMTPNVYGVGCMGIGEFKSTENGKVTRCYNTWSHMMRRSYEPKYQEKNPTYENCNVCEEWHNYQVFAKWFYENYYEVGNEKMDLDKDILCKANKLYSPNTCVFVPHSINSLFTKSDKKRGEYPIGVNKYRDKFQAHLTKGNGKQTYLGTYTTPNEAFQAYKKAKEEYIKEVANEYKGKIDNRAYEALMNYKVEIDD